MIYHPSTSSMLALVALTTSPAPSSSSSSSLFDATASILIRRGHPAAVLQVPSTSASNVQRRNHSMHYYHADENDVDEYDLLDVIPRELAALIASASVEGGMPSASPTPSSKSGMRYYPSYEDGGESCSSKSIEDIGSWEVSYDTLGECCDSSFGWDYDACMNNNGNDDSIDDSMDLLDMLPRELVTLIESASATEKSSMPSSSPTVSSLSTIVGYYPSYDSDLGVSCSSKPMLEFGSWEVWHDTLHACCDVSFGWDYDACMNDGGDAVRI